MTPAYPNPPESSLLQQLVQQLSWRWTEPGWTAMNTEPLQRRDFERFRTAAAAPKPGS